MVGPYDDPFAFDGSEFTTFLTQDPYAGASSPEDFHVSSATDTHFPGPIHGLKDQPFLLSPTDLGPASARSSLDSTTYPGSLPNPGPTSYPSQFHQHQPQPQPNPLTNLGWPSSNPTPPTPSHHAHSQSLPHSSSSSSTSHPLTISIPPNLSSSSDDLATARALITHLQSELRHAAADRDAARMQLSTARNELYAARQVEKRLRTERDEARAQVEFLERERAKGKVVEGRLRRERNEVRGRLAVVLSGGGGHGGNMGRGKGGGNKGGLGGGNGNGREVVMAGMGVESQGEESESPQGLEMG